MAIEFSPAVTDRSGHNNEYGRFHRANWDAINNVGTIQFSLWKDAASCAAGKHHVGTCEIALGASTIKDDDGCFTQIPFSSFAGKSEAQIENAAMSAAAPKKVRITGGIIVDLADGSIV
jgi:hypothetical protein